MAKVSPRVSVIITSFTVEHFQDFIEVLESLHKQTVRDFETLLIVDHSHELYERLCLHVREKGYLDTRIIFNGKPNGLSTARNLGITQAKGDIIAFIDDDAVACPQWIEGMLEGYKDDRVIGVTGPIYPIWEDESMNWCPEELYWLFACTYHNREEPHKVRNGYGANISFRRINPNGNGFFQDWLGSKVGEKPMTAEETEVSVKLTSATGKDIIYSPGMVVRHKVRKYRLSPKYVLGRAYREGFSKMIIKKHFRESNGSSNGFLETEHSLLRSILFRLVPGDIAGLVKKPAVSLKRLGLTFTVLSCVAAGYVRGSLCSVRKYGGR